MATASSQHIHQLCVERQRVEDLRKKLTGLKELFLVETAWNRKDKVSQADITQLKKKTVSLLAELNKISF